MPSSENLYFPAETKCPKCQGNGGHTHGYQGKPIKVACDECGATGFVPIRLTSLEWAKALADAMDRLPTVPWSRRS